MTFDPTAPGTPTVTQIDSAGALTSVACPSANQCTAVDTVGNELTFNPTAPGSPSLNAVDGNPLTGVACPSISDCIAVDGFGNAVEGDPAHPDRWTVTKIPGANALTAVACSSIAQCVVVDQVGKGVVGTKSTSTSVSCAPSSVVVGSAGTCIATVSDVGGAPLSAPSGPVTFSSGGPGSFGGSGSCTLSPTGGTGQASCQLAYTPSAVGSGSHAIAAGYSGDGSHPSSSAHTSVTVTAPAGGGGGGGGGGSGFDTPPALTHFGLTNRTFTVGATSTLTIGTAASVKHKQGTTFTYTLSKAATAKITIARRLPGRVKGKACVAPSRTLRKARSCVRIVIRGTLTRTSHSGLNKVAFSGRIGASALKPGNYQATVIATDAAGKTSNSMTIHFTIAKH
jgi:hypothetical protein